MLGDLAETGRLAGLSPRNKAEPAFLREVAAAELARLLEDEDSGVQRESIVALSKVRAPGKVVLTVMTRALTSSRPELRLAVADALPGYVNRSREIDRPISGMDELVHLEQWLDDVAELAPVFQAGLSSEDSALRGATLQALSGLFMTLHAMPEVSGRNVDPLVVDDETQSRVQQKVVAVVEATRGIFPLLARIVREADRGHRRDAMGVIEKAAQTCDLRPDPVERREQGVSRPRERVPRPRGRLLWGDLDIAGSAGVESLREGLRQTVPALVACLRSPHEELHLAALEALEVLGPVARDAASVVRESLDHRRPFVRWAACRTLAAIGPTGEDAQTIEALARTIADPDLDVAAAACRALGDGFPRQAQAALPALGNALLSRERQLQHAAVLALEPIARELAGEARSLVPALTQALNSADDKTRQAVPVILGHLGRDAAPAVPALQRALHDPNPTVRVEAAEALLRIRTAASQK
jgi:HEAT repeat protein